jgi:hypothetical protein
MDPIRFAGGDTNLYGYVLGDPINWIDPEGERAFRDCWTRCMSKLNPWWLDPLSVLAAYSTFAVGTGFEYLVCGATAKGIAAAGAWAGAGFSGWTMGTSAGCAMSCKNNRNNW